MATSQHTYRPALAAAAFTGLLALVTACGSATPSSTAGASSTPASGSTSAASSPSQTPSSSPASMRASSSPATHTDAAPGCVTSNLKAGLGTPQGTAGSVYVPIVFANDGQTACTLYGFPGVSLGKGARVKQVGLAADRISSPAPKLITVQPGGTANATLRVVDAGNYSHQTCGPVATTWLRVYPPNQRASLVIRYKTTGCTKPVHLLSVGTAQLGSGS